MTSSKTVIGTAHAKVIVLGEHFVVPFTDAQGVEHAGSAAVAVPLPNLRTQVQLSSASSVSCELADASSDQVFDERAFGLMEKALGFAANRFQWDLRLSPLKALSSSNFPLSRGLGSSASFSVALARAFAQLSGKNADIALEAQLIEGIFHGKSSGLDTSSIVSDSAILFQSGRVLETFVPTSVDFVVADSGPRSASSSLVSRTLEFRAQKPDLWRTLSTQVTELSKNCVRELQNPNGASEVARIVRNSQEILEQIGLMNDPLGNLLALGKNAGALAGKMSGAGAGGVALFVARRGEGLKLAERMKNAGAKVVTVV